MASQKHKRYPCEICGKIFSNTGYLNVHMRLHTGERPYQCSLCKKAFHTTCKLKAHEATHSNLKPYSCDLCQKQFKTLYYCKAHILRHGIKGTPFKCDICSATFKEERKLKEHSKQRHDPNYSGGFKCVFCGKVYSSKWNLEGHIIMHIQERPYFCKLCPAEIQLQVNFNRHMKSHDPDRPRQFKCDRCPKMYFERRPLESHMRSHVIDRRFECEICGKGFRGGAGLKSHRRVHLESFPCKACGETFKSKDEQTLHRMNAHPKQRTVACPLCSKLFFTNKELRGHIPVHMHERPYKCVICGKDFKSPNSLKRHSRIHSKVKD